MLAVFKFKHSARQQARWSDSSAYSQKFPFLKRVAQGLILMRLGPPRSSENWRSRRTAAAPVTGPECVLARGYTMSTWSKGYGHRRENPLIITVKLLIFHSLWQLGDKWEKLIMVLSTSQLQVSRSHRDHDSSIFFPCHAPSMTKTTLQRSTCCIKMMIPEMLWTCALQRTQKPAAGSNQTMQKLNIGASLVAQG